MKIRHIQVQSYNMRRSGSEGDQREEKFSSIPCGGEQLLEALRPVSWLTLSSILEQKLFSLGAELKIIMNRRAICM